MTVYTEQEVLEIIRQIIYYGDPAFYENGGVTGCINFPKGGTYAKAKDYFNKYWLNKQQNVQECDATKA